MISQKNIRLALRAPLLAAAIVPPADIAWELRTFDPAGKSLWIRESLLPTYEDPIAQRTYEFSGIMVYDVFAPSATGTETIEATVKTLGDLYSPDNAPLTGTGVKIVLDSVSRKAPIQDGVWAFIPVHIVFKAYAT